MSFFEPTRDITLINRRRLIGFLSMAVAGGIISRREAMAYYQDSSQKTGIDTSKWNTETINAMAGTREIDTAADLHALVPETTEGTVQYWNVGPTNASPDLDWKFYDE